MVVESVVVKATPTTAAAVVAHTHEKAQPSGLEIKNFLRLHPFPAIILKIQPTNNTQTGGTPNEGLEQLLLFQERS